MSAPRLVVLLLLQFVLLSQSALTATPQSELLPGAQLPAGETVVAMAWPDAHTLCLVVRSGDGYAIRDLDTRSGEFQVVAVPPSFKRLRHSTQPEFILAEDAAGLAVLQPQPGPLKPAELAVFSRSGNKFDGVELRGIPANFWVDKLAWGEASQLYLVARPYLNPEQPYSVGRLDVPSGRFEGVVLRGNLDLVDQLAVLPASRQLVIRCWGVRGEYPKEPVIALWDLDQPQSTLLHSRARFLTIASLDKQQALLQSQNRGGSETERWILAQGQTTLRRLERGMAASSKQLRISNDGKWLVVQIEGRELSTQLDSDKLYVAMQALGSGRTMATAVPCEAFAISPDSSTIATLAAGGQKVYYYTLPTVN